MGTLAKYKYQWNNVTTSNGNAPSASFIWNATKETWDRAGDIDMAITSGDASSIHIQVDAATDTVGTNTAAVDINMITSHRQGGVYDTANYLGTLGDTIADGVIKSITISSQGVHPVVPPVFKLRLDVNSGTAYIEVYVTVRSGE